MPALVLTTNVKPDNVREFVLDFSKLGADVLKKPEAYISIQYNYDENLTFAGTFEPAFLMEITSLDNLNPEVNKTYSSALFAYLKEKLGIPNNRGYIKFDDPGRENLGYSGTTFATIFAGK